MFWSSSGNMLSWEGFGINVDKRWTNHQETAAGQSRRVKPPKVTDGPEAANQKSENRQSIDGGFIRRGKSRFPEVLNSSAHVRRVQSASQCPPSRRAKVARMTDEITRRDTSSLQGRQSSRRVRTGEYYPAVLAT